MTRRRFPNGVRAGLAAIVVLVLMLVVSQARAHDWPEGEILLERGFVELVFPNGVIVRSSGVEQQWDGGRYLFRADGDRIVSGGRDLGPSARLTPKDGPVRVGKDRQAEALLLQINDGLLRVIAPHSH